MIYGQFLVFCAKSSQNQEPSIHGGLNSDIAIGLAKWKVIQEKKEAQICIDTPSISKLYLLLMLNNVFQVILSLALASPENWLSPSETLPIYEDRVRKAPLFRTCYC